MTTDLLQRAIAGGKQHVDARWDERRSELALVHAKKRRRRRRAVRLSAYLTGALALLAGGFFWGARSPQGLVAPPVGPAPVASDSHSVDLRDGVRVQLLTQGARVTAAVAPVAVAPGRYRFEVSEGSALPLSIHAGRVVIEVASAVFMVDRKESEIQLRVVSGRLLIRGDGVARALSAGESRVIDLAEAPATIEPFVEQSVRAPVRQKQRADPRRWRVLAGQGGYDEAYALLTAPKAAKVRDEAEDLLLAADVARLSGHAQKAVPYLRQVAKRHRRDPRAPLAAFTLGRILLKELGRPRQAAEAFAEARALEPAGSLAQDALAREVEAWHRAGESDLARARALRYLQLFPNAQRNRSVRHFGGLQK